MAVALETYWSTIEVILDAKNLFDIWLGLLLRKTGQISFGLHWWRCESQQPSLFEHFAGKSFFPCLTEPFENNYVFKEDGVQAYTANATNKWCKDHFRGFGVNQW